MFDGTTALTVNGSHDPVRPRPRAGDGPSRTGPRKKEKAPRLLGLNRTTGHSGPGQAVPGAGRREPLKSKGGRADLNRTLTRTRSEPHGSDGRRQNLDQLRNQQNHHCPQRLQQNEKNSAPHLRVSHIHQSHQNLHQNHQSLHQSLHQNHQTLRVRTKANHTLLLQDPAPPHQQDLDQDLETAYAGAKFSEPPAPSVLPPPPTRWVRPGHGPGPGPDHGPGPGPDHGPGPGPDHGPGPGPDHGPDQGLDLGLGLNGSRDEMSLRLKTLLRVQDQD